MSDTVYIIKDGEVTAVSHYDLIMSYAEKTTTPRGVDSKIHLRESDDGKFEVWTWGHQGNFPRKIREFDLKSDADEFIFDCALTDYQNDDDAPMYYETRSEALKVLKSL